MNDKQLRSFMTVAESKSFAQAAEKVFVSVPALKKQIDTLENEIDASLVRRSSQGVRLTAAGKYFYERCKHMLKYIDDTLHAIQSIGNRELNTIRIGYCSDYYRTQDPYYFDALCNFVNRYPDVKVIFTRIGDKSEEVYDLCINAHAKYVSKMTPHVLCAMQVYCIIKNNHPLSKKAALHLQDLHNYRLMIDSATAIAELHPGLYDSLLAGGFSLLDMERLGEESPYSRLLSSDEAYICFGLSKSLHKGLVQIPLTGYQFTYQLFSSPVMEKPIVKTYIEFIQNYYRNHLREETNPLSEP